MSNALSIATVTAVIKNLLENGLVSDAIAASVGDVLVTALPPDKIQVGSDERAQINLFLYHVTQNRNVDWVSQEYRSRHSVINTRTTNPPLALDLHYVLTAYGAKDFQAEILLGFAMQLLHKLPVLASETIENALKNAAETSTASVFSQAISGLSVSEIANRLGQIKVSPAFLNMEETTRIWSALQTNYRPSATYQASMVLIDSENTDKLKDTISLPSEPTIEQITAPTSQTGGNITVGSTLLIRGKQLRGDITKVRLGNIDNKLFTPFDVQDTQVSLQIPPEIRAGVQSVQIVHETIKNKEHVIESNVAPFVLHPKINVVETLHVTSLQDGQSYSAEISIKLIPKVNKSQRISVQLNQISKTDPATYSSMAPVPTEDTDTITIPFKNIKPGEYLVRVKVDGAESQLNKNQSGEYDSPKITIK